MKYLFVIQGEGRGHFTQALSMKEMLEKNGHEVGTVMIGCSAKRVVPEFFLKKINAEVVRFQSPNFLPSPKSKSSHLLISIVYNLIFLPVYIQSLFRIRKTIKQAQADVVVNFYELMCGITYGIFNPQTPMINVAHQYYFKTSSFNYTGKNPIQFKLLNFFSTLTSLNATKILALSFREESFEQHGNIAIVPPLLRKEVLNKVPTNGDYINGYLLNAGYVDELIDWSLDNPKQMLHFFCDRVADDDEILIPNLKLHTLSDSLFLEFMAGCKAYATTGGFESVCEAMYLQKPVLMVPTHIEQECNVLDAMRAGAGVGASEFNLDLLLQFLEQYKKINTFKYWVNSAESVFMHELALLPSHNSEILITI